VTIRTSDETGKLERQFLEFHAEHPEVYVELVALADELIDRGYRRFGIKMLYEVCRWRSMRRAKPGEAFKLNNNHTAFYARMIMDREPRLRDIFNLREQGIPSHVA
jgi:hypothetical protein